MSNHPNIHIANGRVIDPANGIDEIRDVCIADGCIISTGTVPDNFKAEKIIDAKGLHVIPGIIDLCARVREPGLEHKATIDSECKAAAASGITTLCTPPDTHPVIDTPAVVELIRNRSEKTAASRIVCIGALTRGLDGAYLSEMAALKNAGCVGVSNAQKPLASTQIERRTFEYAATFDLTVFIYADEYSLSEDGVLHEGQISTRLGLPGIPRAAETVAVARDLALIEQTGVRAHFCHLTTRSAARMVARAQFDGLPISADVATPYLYFTDIDACQFDANYHFKPPLRPQSDQLSLRQGLRDGTLSVLCSDHQPHELEAKRSPFPSTAPGASGIDTLLPLALRLAEEKTLSLLEAVARITSGPAKVLNIPYGNLAVGRTADICIYDPEKIWRVSDANLYSNGKNTPFHGWEMKGRTRYTLRNGKVIFSSQQP